MSEKKKYEKPEASDLGSGARGDVQACSSGGAVGTCLPNGLTAGACQANGLTAAVCNSFGSGYINQTNCPSEGTVALHCNSGLAASLTPQ